MARYIDADELYKKLYPLDLADKRTYTINAKAVADAIANIPTADVVPRAEAENYKSIAEHQQKLSIDRYFEIKQLKQELDKAKSKVEYLQSELDICELIYGVTPNLPCKVGDEVWAIRTYNGKDRKVIKGKVSEIYFINEQMTPCIVVKGITRGLWGEIVFPTFEAAQNKIDGV